MRTLQPLLWLACLITALFACRTSPAKFVHKDHLGGKACDPATGDDCLSCASCHQSIESTGSMKHPSGSNCIDCHEKDSHKALASLSAPESPASKQAKTILFDHDSHLQMKGIDGQCIKCHSGLVSDEGGPDFPPMESCFQCHNHQQQWDQGVCLPCHQQADLGRLFPQTLLRHGPGWDRAHGDFASASTKQCEACHTSASCDDCHDVTQGLSIEARRPDLVEKDWVHPPDFISRHSLEAQTQQSRCVSCHRPETCDSCHIKSGVSANRMDATNPHPLGWTGPDSSASNHHGRAARRDIISCAGCHDAGPTTNCIQCHSVGGPGGNPHPDGWKSTRTPNAEMCRYCHGG